jgi:oxaloacetate decarboxylase (Na+ extruding) subunit alpha
VPEADLARMRAAGPVQRSFPLMSSPDLEQVQRLARIVKSPVLQMSVGELSLELRRHRI